MLTSYYRARARLARRWTPLNIALERPWPTRRRGFKLWLVAGAVGLRGVLYAAAPSTRSEAFRFPYDWISTQGWGVFVVVVCALAAFTAYCHFGRDRYGYVLMVMLTSGWAAAYVFGWGFRGAGDAALQGALSLGVLAAFLLHSAGDPEISRS